MASISSTESDEDDLSLDIGPKDSMDITPQDSSNPHASLSSPDVSDDSDSEDKFKSMYNIFNPYHVPGRHKLKNYAADNTNQELPDSMELYDKTTMSAVSVPGVDGEDAPHTLKEEESDLSSPQKGETETISELEKTEIDKSDFEIVKDSTTENEEFDQHEVETVKDSLEGDRVADRKSESGDTCEPVGKIVDDSKIEAEDTCDSEGDRVNGRITKTKETGKAEGETVNDNKSETEDKHEGEETVHDTEYKEIQKKIPPSISPKPKSWKKPKDDFQLTEPPPIPPRTNVIMKSTNANTQPVEGARSEPPPVKEPESLSIKPVYTEEQLVGEKLNLMNNEDESDGNKYQANMHAEENESGLENKNYSKSDRHGEDESNNAVFDDLKSQKYSIDEAMDITSSKNQSDIEESKVLQESSQMKQAVKDQQTSYTHDSILITDTMMADNSMMRGSGSDQDSTFFGYSFIEITPSLGTIGENAVRVDDASKSPEVKCESEDMKDDSDDEPIAIFDNSDEEYRSADEGTDEGDDNDDFDDSIDNFQDERNHFKSSFTEFWRPPGKTGMEEQLEPTADKETMNKAISDIENTENISGEIANGALSITSHSSNSSSIIVLTKGSCKGDFKSISSKVSEGDLTGAGSYDMTETSEIEEYRKQYIEDTLKGKEAHSVIDNKLPTEVSEGDVKLEIRSDHIDSMNESFAVLSQNPSSEGFVDVRDKLTEVVGSEVKPIPGEEVATQGCDSTQDNTLKPTSITEEGANYSDIDKESSKVEDVNPPPIEPKSLDVLNYIASMSESKNTDEPPKLPPRTGPSSIKSDLSMPSVQPSLPHPHTPGGNPHYPNLGGGSVDPHQQAQSYWRGSTGMLYNQTNMPQQPYSPQFYQQQQQQHIWNQLTPEQRNQMMHAWYYQYQQYTHGQASVPPESTGVHPRMSYPYEPTTFGQPRSNTAISSMGQGQPPSHPSNEPSSASANNQANNTNTPGKGKQDETDSKPKVTTKSTPSAEKINLRKHGTDDRKKDAKGRNKEPVRIVRHPSDGEMSYNKGRKAVVKEKKWTSEKDRGRGRSQHVTDTKDRSTKKTSESKKFTSADVRPKQFVERKTEKKPVPEKPEESYMYISGMNPKTVKENLINYLEGRLGGAVDVVSDKVIHEPANAQALIVFSKKPDFELLFSELKSKRIDKVHLKGEEVRPPIHIAVSFEGSMINPESLELYFERIGDAAVTHPARESEDGSCFILGFEDKKVVERLCIIEHHEFDKHILRVSPYYIYEGGAIWDHTIHAIPKAEPIELSPPPEHYSFLKRCCSVELGALIETKYGVLEWPPNVIKINCTLTPKIDGFKKLIKAWPAEMTACVSSFMSRRITEKDICLVDESDVWAKLVERVTFTDEENLNIFKDNVRKVITFTGSANEVQSKHRETTQKIQAIQRELRRKTESKHSNASKLKLLASTGKIDEIRREFDDTHITEDKGKVTVEGQEEDIQSVFVKIWEHLTEVVEEHVPLKYSDDCIRFVATTKKLLLRINNAMDTEDIKAEWEWKGTELLLWCPSDVKPSHVANIILSQIDEITIKLDREMQGVLKTDNWQNFSEDITETFTEVGYDMQSDAVVVYGCKEQVKDLVSQMNSFLDENAVRKEVVHMDQVKLQFIVVHRSDKVREIEQSCGNQSVTIKLLESDGNILISGKKAGIALAKKSLDRLGKDITSDTHTIKKIGVIGVYKSEMTKGTIDNIERETCCLIKSPYDETADSIPVFELDHNVDEVGGAGGGYESAEEASETETIPDNKELNCKNGIVISLIQGEIGNEAADVLVATCAQNLDLKLGGASKSLLLNGGRGLQNELRDKHKEIKHGDLLKIKGGQLECSQVYLTSLPNWTSDGGCSTLIKNFMTECLQSLAAKKKRSILFSALGTGQLKYPHAQVAQLMYQSVIDFDSKTTNSSVEEVKFIMYPKDTETIKAFEEELKCLKDGGKRPTFGIQSNNVHVEMVIEDVAAQKVDAILCSSSEDMNLSKSGAASALLKVGGKALQDGANAFKNALKDGQVGKVVSGNLGCKAVFLTVLPTYSKDTEKVLPDAIKSFLTLCHLQGYSKVAMPAMGTGYLKYPKQFVSRAMFDAVRDWAVDNPGGSVTSVRFVMYAKDYEVIEAFKVQIKQRQGGGLTRKGRLLCRSISRPDDPKQQKYKMFESGCYIGDVTLTVKVGDLVNEKADAIVSSLGKPCQFLGAVAQVLTKKCPQLEEKCQKKQTKLDATGVICTLSDKGIPAPHIIHVHFQETLGDWQKYILKCLEKANEKGFKSLAFPVLGTGAGNVVMKPDEIAGSLFSAIDEFVSKGTISRRLKLKDVRVVVYHKQHSMKDAFLKGLSAKAHSVLTGKKGKLFSKFNEMKDTMIGLISAVVDDKVTGFVDKLVGNSQSSKVDDAENTSSLSLTIYSDDKENIKKCKDQLDSKLEKAYSKKKIDTYKELIKSMTKEELAELDNIPVLANIKIDQTNGVILIDGPLRYVSEADTSLQTRLRTIERNRNTAKEAKTLYNLVKWHYEDITALGINLEAYDERSNLRIETAYKDDKKSSVKLEDSDGNVYMIDFNKMVEYLENNPNEVVKVMRKDIIKGGSYQLPDFWAPMGDAENIKIVNIQSNSKEYTDLETKFVTQAKSGPHAFKIQNVQNIKVSKIERIQNKTLFQQYLAKKKHIESDKPKLPANMPLEQSLWHGTNQQAVASIQRHGFNRSYCGRNGIWFGAGVYFAADASYSARPWLAQGNQNPSAPPGQNKGYIFCCKVLTGQFLKGNDKMRYLPPVDPAKSKTLMYDSAVDDMNKPMEYVIFHDTQAYPDYIITFLL